MLVPLGNLTQHDVTSPSIVNFSSVTLPYSSITFRRGIPFGQRYLMRRLTFSLYTESSSGPALERSLPSFTYSPLYTSMVAGVPSDEGVASAFACLRTLFEALQSGGCETKKNTRLIITNK